MRSTISSCRRPVHAILLLIAAACAAGADPDRSPEIRMKVLSGPGEFLYPDPVILQVALSGAAPIASARVTATATAPSGREHSLVLTERFLPGATRPGSGSYAGVMTDIAEDGTYSVVVRASDGGTARVASSFSGESRDDTQRSPASGPRAVPPFEIRSEFSFNTVDYAGQPPLPPLRVTTLYGEQGESGCVELSWLVPPNVVIGEMFEVRYSTNSITGDAAWNRATPTKPERYSNKGGEDQKHELCGLPKARLHFAVRSLSGDSRRSELSNDYIVVVD